MFKVIRYQTIGSPQVVFTGSYGECQGYINQQLTTVNNRYQIFSV
jgi:hypothetical protein